MIKAAFFDIDGTLISFKTHLVPESAMRALRGLKEKGVKIFISTGRAPTSISCVKDIVPLDIFDGFIAVNGQFCFSKNEVIRDCTIPTENIAPFLPYLKEMDISCVFVERDYTYINKINSRVLAERNSLGGSIPKDPIDSPERIFKNKTYQIGPFISEDEEKEALKYLPGCRAVRWHPLFTDIIPAEGGKGVGVHSVLEYYGIDVSESMAFGDGGNDIEMLQAAGIGVAMGNASEKVKASADYVTADADGDGIYNALKAFDVL